MITEAIACYAAGILTVPLVRLAIRARRESIAARDEEARAAERAARRADIPSSVHLLPRQQPVPDDDRRNLKAWVEGNQGVTSQDAVR